MRSIFSIITPLFLLIIGSVLLVNTITFSHSSNEHGIYKEMTDCPFMSHEETLCPMTILDHISIFRSIFETILPSIVSITLIAGVLLITYLHAPKLKNLFRIHTHTLWRWRIFVTYSFSYRLYQDLFSQGILHPKLF